MERVLPLCKGELEGVVKALALCGWNLKSLNPKYKGRPFYRCPARERGKSGQHRASCFLTGRSPRGGSSVTENNRSVRGIRVKR